MSDSIENLFEKVLAVWHALIPGRNDGVSVSCSHHRTPGTVMTWMAAIHKGSLPDGASLRRANGATPEDALRNLLAGMEADAQKEIADAEKRLARARGYLAEVMAAKGGR